MKLSSKTRYALRTVLALAVNYQRGLIQGSEIAAKHGIPKKFLQQILLTLKNGGIVASSRGRRGGYSLAKPPAQVAISAIIRLTEGDGGAGYESKGRQKMCGLGERALGEICLEIQNYTTGRLDQVTLQNMLDRDRELGGAAGMEYVI